MLRKKLPNFKIAGAIEYKGKPIKAPFLYAEDKLDGLRMVVIVRDPWHASAYTRNGCLIPNAYKICKIVASCFDVGQGGVFDGEGIAAPDWNMSTKVIMTQTVDAKLAAMLRFRVFDFLTLKDWDKKICNTPLKERKKELARHIKYMAQRDTPKSKTPLRVSMVKHTELDSTPEEIRYFMTERAKAGLEGGVFKDPESFYSFRKNKDWLKLKPKKEADVKIIGIKWGKKGKTGQMVGLIGSLKCEGRIEGKQIVFHSSGMKMKLRKEMTKMHKHTEDLVGKIVEVEYDCLTVNNAVRFPRFKRLRLDKEQ